MKICQKCKGEGKIAAPPAFPRFRSEYNKTTCPKCGGTGQAQQMIFWRYDLFPFVLGAPGTLQDDGTAFVPSFQGNFRPIHIMPVKEGREMLDRIKALAHEQETALTAVRAGFHARLKEVAPWVIKK